MLDVAEATSVFAVLSHSKLRVTFHDDSRVQGRNAHSNDIGQFPAFVQCFGTSVLVIRSRLIDFLMDTQSILMGVDRSKH